MYFLQVWPSLVDLELKFRPNGECLTLDTGNPENPAHSPMIRLLQVSRVTSCPGLPVAEGFPRVLKLEKAQANQDDLVALI